MKFSTLHVVQIVVFIFASSNSAQMHKNPQSDRLYTIKNEKLHVSITTRCSTRISLLYAYFRILLKHDRPFLRPPFASLCRAFSKYLVLRYFLRYRLVIVLEEPNYRQRKTWPMFPHLTV